MMDPLLLLCPATHRRARMQVRLNIPERAPGSKATAALLNILACTAPCYRCGASGMRARMLTAMH